MKLYTIQEVIDDIKSSCGIDISLNNIVKNVRFVNLYSDYFPSPPDNATVNEFKQSVQNYLNNFDNALAPCDIWPTNEHLFYLYKVNVPDNGSIFDSSMSLIGAAGNKENIFKLFDSDVVKEQAQHLCVVSVGTREVMYLDRATLGSETDKKSDSTAVSKEKSQTVDFTHQALNQDDSEKVQDLRHNASLLGKYFTEEKLNNNRLH
jgi:hypothetical protein